VNQRARGARRTERTRGDNRTREKKEAHEQQGTRRYWRKSESHRIKGPKDLREQEDLTTRRNLGPEDHRASED